MAECSLASERSQVQVLLDLRSWGRVILDCFHAQVGDWMLICCEFIGCWLKVCFEFEVHSFLSFVGSHLKFDPELEIFPVVFRMSSLLRIIYGLKKYFQRIFYQVLKSFDLKWFVWYFHVGFCQVGFQLFLAYQSPFQTFNQNPPKELCMSCRRRIYL